LTISGTDDRTFHQQKKKLIIDNNSKTIHTNHLILCKQQF